MVSRIEDQPAEFRELYPFTHHYMEIDGPRMHFVDEGQESGGDGPPVLMLHGNPTWSFFYRDLIKGLRDSRRVVVPDHIGCGLSDKPQDYPYRLKRHIENAQRLVNHLELDAFDLVVHDWGGAIGFGMARLMPDRVRRIVVLNTAAFFGRLSWPIAVCRWPLIGPLGVRGLNLFSRAAVVMAVHKKLPAKVKTGYLFPYGQWRERIAVQRFVEDIPTRRSHPSYGLIEEIDRELWQFRDRRMMICWGMRDFCFDESFLIGWCERFPEAEVHRFPDAGHLVLEDAGREVLTLVREFLGVNKSTVRAISHSNETGVC
jgi:haloalkane dehalogenase